MEIRDDDIFPDLLKMKKLLPGNEVSGSGFHGIATEERLTPKVTQS
jgi:hypothetical protein